MRPRTLLEITWVAAQRQLEMEWEAVMYLEGRSSRGAWVMQDRTRAVVAQWDDIHGYSFIEEQDTEDEIFINRWVVKRTEGPRGRQNLWAGELVEFVKALGPRGYFAAGVTHVEEEATRPEDVTPPVTTALVPVTTGLIERNTALASAEGS